MLFQSPLCAALPHGVQVYKNFKEGKHRILVATDLVGRGIDIERVNIVINYDMPESDDKATGSTKYGNGADTYLHRVRPEGGLASEFFVLGGRGGEGRGGCRVGGDWARMVVHMTAGGCAVGGGVQVCVCGGQSRPAGVRVSCRLPAVPCPHSHAAHPLASCRC